MGTQSNLKSRKSTKECNVVDFDDLWIRSSDDTADVPNVYIRHQEQENEIDVLWAGVKDNQHNGFSPLVYLGAGFFTGLISATFIAAIFFWGNPHQTSNIEVAAPTSRTNLGIEQKQIKVPDMQQASSTSSSAQYQNVRHYTIQSGDSLGKIASKFYHSSAPEKVALIQKANNLDSPHSITAGKKLIIPVSE